MSKLSDRDGCWRKATSFPSTVSSGRQVERARRATLTGPPPVLEPLLDRLAPPRVGVANSDFWRRNGSFGQVLVHGGGPYACHVRSRLHIDEIERYRLEWGLGAVFHGAQCVPKVAAERGRWAM